MQNMYLKIKIYTENIKSGDIIREFYILRAMVTKFIINIKNEPNIILHTCIHTGSRIPVSGIAG